MAKWKFLTWKTLSIILLSIFIPLIVNLIAAYIIWFRTRERVEITLKLDGWITIGQVLESDLPNLKLLYNDKPVKNALKISWRIINTGSEGISEFETRPTLGYPGKFNITEAKISQTSPLLNIDKNLSINSEHRTIEVNDIGIFNKGDFFKIDVYIMDIPESMLSIDYFTDWDLIAKSVDLQLKKDITLAAPREEIASLLEKFLKTYLPLILYIIFRLKTTFPL